jgi:S-DNA-T family DNA segregation ATPase FtsK/SpoIIIE
MPLVQARKRKSTPSVSFKILPYLKRGLQEVGFLLFTAIALYLIITLVSYKVEDPAWTHTGPMGQVGNWGGVVGARLADILLYFFGYLVYLVPLSIGFCGWRLFRCGTLGVLDAEIVMFRLLGFFVALGGGCGLVSLHLTQGMGYLNGSPGGILGDIIGPSLVTAFGFWGGNLFLLVLLLASITLATGLSWLGLLEWLGKITLSLSVGFMNLVVWLRHWLSAGTSVTGAVSPSQGVEAVDLEQPVGSTQSDLFCEAKEKLAIQGEALIPDQRINRRIEPVFRLPAEPKRSLVSEPSIAVAALSTAVDESQLSPVLATPAATKRQLATLETAYLPGSLPPLQLLNAVPSSQIGYSPEALDDMSRQLEILLRHYGIEVKVVAVEPGPVITCFELELAPGVKVSQISSLSKDLARGLSVLSVRVVEIIPGKSVVGLEIPNQQREIVYLKEVLASPVYVNSTAPTTLALGKDISGNPVVANLAKMPHLLVAGTTGSGKSVAVNAMLLSLLYKASPEEVRLILVDPKMLELSVYEGIPHLLAPVVTDMKEAANALRWCVAEMEQRYRLMAALQVRNIAGFNRKISDAAAVGQVIADPFHGGSLAEGEASALAPLPFIVVVIDELADMMMIVGKKVEELIARLAQKARASGIHLILATQRPSVDVITGLIKANIPTRIAFQVSSKVDSRTILDQSGAEQLLGYGDMLYLPPGTGFPKRVHGAFVDDQEVSRVVDYLRQRGEPHYLSEVLQGPVETGGGFAEEDSGGYGGGESDPLYDEAVRIVTETRRASISAVQRRLRIGYNRAARMIEEMEQAGIVGPLQSNGSREVLVSPPPA